MVHLALERSAVLGEDVHRVMDVSRQDRTVNLDVGAQEWKWCTQFPEGQKLNQVVKELKRSLIEEALKRAGGSPTRAGSLLGITRHAMNKQIKTLDIKVSR